MSADKRRFRTRCLPRTTVIRRLDQLHRRGLIDRQPWPQQSSSLGTRFCSEHCKDCNATVRIKTELTATKRNPGQFTLPGLLQFVASACRLFDPGGVGGWGTPGSGLDSFNPNWLFELRGSRMIIWWRLLGC